MPNNFNSHRPLLEADFFKEDPSNGDMPDIFTRYSLFALEQMEIALFCTDHTDKFIYTNNPASRMLGVGRNIPHSFYDLPPENIKFLLPIYEKCKDSKEEQHIESIPVYCGNDTHTYYTGQMRIIHEKYGYPVIIGIFQDITNRSILENKLIALSLKNKDMLSNNIRLVLQEYNKLKSYFAILKKRENSCRRLIDKYKNILQTSSLGLLSLSYEGLILDADKNAADILGLNSIDMTQKSMINIRDNFFAYKDQWDYIMHKVQNNNALLKEEVKLSLPDRGTVWIELSGTSMPEQSLPSGFEALVADITDRKTQEQKLYDMATLDSLTGIPNRVLWMDRLEQSIRQYRRYGGSFGILFLDLDGFKTINDKHGHQAGDMLLKEAVCRIKKKIRQSDTLARIGGDEFALMINNVKELRNVLNLAASILDSIQQPFIVDHANVHLGISIGICIYDDPSLTSDEIMKRADMAMYQAKKHGGSRYVLYTPEMNGHSTNDRKTERPL